MFSEFGDLAASFLDQMMCVIRNVLSDKGNVLLADSIDKSLSGKSSSGALRKRACTNCFLTVGARAGLSFLTHKTADQFAPYNWPEVYLLVGCGDGCSNTAVDSEACTSGQSTA